MSLQRRCPECGGPVEGITTSVAVGRFAIHARVQPPRRRIEPCGHAVRVVRTLGVETLERP